MVLRARALLEFTRTLDGLKTHTRTAWTASGRKESIADHSLRLTLLAFAIAPELPGIDAHRLVELCLVHDLGETFEGDISAPLQPGAEDEKSRQEREAIERLAAILGGPAADRLRARVAEYAAGASAEARVAKALDKIETIIQHNQGDNPPDFDYEFNLGYGADLALDADILEALRRLVDDETRGRARSR